MMGGEDDEFKGLTKAEIDLLVLKYIKEMEGSMRQERIKTRIQILGVITALIAYVGAYAYLFYQEYTKRIGDVAGEFDPEPSEPTDTCDETRKKIKESGL